MTETYRPLARRTWALHIAAAFFRTIFWLFTRLQVKGVENVPVSGPLIAVSNHLNNTDSPLILMGFPRWVNFMGKEELFQNAILARVMRFFRVFPVQKGENSIRGKRSALRLAKQVIDSGMVLGTYPEGTRSKSWRLQAGLPGITFIALKNPAPILPMAITGTQGLHGPLWIFKRPAVTLTIGKPFNLPVPENGTITKQLLADCTSLIMEHIAELLPPEYRGGYGGPDSAANAGD